MINVCANYCGATILLESFETKDEAEEFMTHDYVLFYADEIENGEEDEIIYTDEMFIEDELPFFESYEQTKLNNKLELDELPF